MTEVRRDVAVGLNGHDLFEGPPRNTDVGLSQRFAHDHRGDVIFVDGRTPYVWDGRRYVEDKRNEVKRRAKLTVRGIFREALYLDDGEARKALIKFALKSESGAALREMVDLARSEPGMSVLTQELNRDDLLLNATNGTVELPTQTLRAPNRLDLITKCTASPFVPHCRHPVFDRFLDRALPDEPLRRYAQKVAGYCLSGRTVEEKLWFNIGPTASGKTTLLKAIQRTMGDYAAVVPFDALLETGREGAQPRDEIGALEGVRLAIASEVNERARLAEALIKSLTGGDDVRIRRLYEKSREMRPKFKVWCSANFRPRVRDDDPAIWRRIHVVPFLTSVPPSERDPGLKDILCDPDGAGPAVLAWAIEGFRLWQEEGLGKPPLVEEATASYRQAMDPLQGFWECCVLEPDAKVPTGDLRGRYEAWARENGVRHPLTPNGFAERLQARGCQPDRGTKGTRVWRGIRLRTLFDPDRVTPVTAGDAVSTSSRHARAWEGSSGNDVTGVTAVTREPGEDDPGEFQP